MRHLFMIVLILAGFSSVLLGQGSPQWHLKGTHEGWKDDFLALQYFHHSELQRQWAWHLLGRYHFLGHEKILDFGCGDGKITAELSHFIPQGHLTGVDLSPSMIAVASRCFPNHYYPNLTFEKTTDVDFSDDYQAQKYDVIYSLCVFHLVANPVPTLKNLRECLADDARLLLVIPIGNNPAFFKAANETFEKYVLKAPWAGKEQASNALTMRTEEGCHTCLKAAGFEPISIVALHTPTAFFNKQELVEWMMGTVAPNWQIPLEISEAFFHDLIQRMAELDQDVIDSSGAYHMKLSRLEVVAKPAN